MAEMNVRSVAFLALFAGTYAALTILPGFRVVGLPSAEIDFVRGLEPVYGIMLGPIIGPGAAFLGAVVGKLIFGEISSIIFTPLALVSTLIAAFIYQRSFFRAPGWALSSAIMGALIIAWYLTPTGIQAPLYPIFHIFAMIGVLTLRGRLTTMLRSSVKKEVVLGMFICSFAATMAGNMLGNLVFIFLFNPSPLLFVGLLPITLIERVIISWIATGVGASLLISIKDKYFIKRSD